MKHRRWIISILAVVLLVSYIAAYRFLPWRDAGRARHAGVFVHYRQFRHDWQVFLFAPAGFVESLMIRAHPEPFLPHPSWASYLQVLVLEGDQAKVIFPLDAFQHPDKP